LAKIAVKSAEPAGLAVHTLARGEDWAVRDIVCGYGPRDRPFEEQHTSSSIAIVLEGTFQYRSGRVRELMTPGSLLLGNAGQIFECGHEHGAGDRCISFSYAADFGFKVLRLPPLRALSSLTARVCSALRRKHECSWEELSIELAAEATRLANGLSSRYGNADAAGVARVTRVVRMIEHELDQPHSLAEIARDAGLSPSYFLRTFTAVTGLTPHQYVRRSRLHAAATRLRIESARITDIALDCGFGDVSNFNRAFRAEFGVSPRAYRHGLKD
jgi:AraC-like DNA-binding protein